MAQEYFPESYIASSVAAAIRSHYKAGGLCPQNDTEGYKQDVHVVTVGNKLLIQIGDATFSATITKEG